MGFSLPRIGSSGELLDRETCIDSPRLKIPWLRVGQTVLFCGIRLAFAGFLLLTSAYCVLVWVPFSYFGFIHNPLMGWIPVFVHVHAWVYGLLLLAVAVTLAPDLRRSEMRRSVVGFLAVNGVAFLYMWRVGGLAKLQPDMNSYIWSMLSLFPLVWLACLDLSIITKSALSELGEGLNLARAISAAVIVSTAFAATSALREAVEASAVSAGFLVEGLAASLCFHLVIFTIVGFILVLIKKVAGITPWPKMLSFLLTRVFAWWLCAQALRTMVLPTISFEGTQADIFATVTGGAIVLFGTALAVRLRASRSLEQSAEAWGIVPRWLWLFATLGLLAVAYSIPVVLGPTDWDFVLQKTTVIALWLLTLQMVCWAGVPFRGKASSITMLAVLTVAVAGFAHYAVSTLYSSNPSPIWQGIVDNYSGIDISFKTASEVLSRRVDNKAYRQFYDFLKQHTNLGRDVAAGPADVRLVSNLQPSPGTKPNIFLFVLDSLRQDYVSPYNSAVDYTPEIDRFARDSIVLKNAYTRYGGTALSEPAIWTGAMQLHKQYIEPFYPMNNLQKLLETDGYQSYISVDPILQVMLAPSASITELDKDCKSWADLEFVATLKELETKIDSRSDPQKPIFAYTQPQNVHTLTLERSQIKGGRKAVGIYELRRMDKAFGEFVEFLRQRGLYDNSIIIITADHGDSYGEFGRWGHSDFLFPEVIRVPLIVHLPPRLRDHLVWDEHAVAFNADITPSLYYLLGHRPVINNEMFGRPLFTQTAEEATAYKRSQYLIVCSYGPVYAILGGEGQSLFIVDAVNSKSYYYNLTDDPTGVRSHVTVQLQNENEALIRHEEGLIDDLYHWHPATN